MVCVQARIMTDVSAAETSMSGDRYLRGGKDQAVTGTAIEFVPRAVADTVDEMLAGAERLGSFRPADARSPAAFERVRIEGEPCVVKYVHVDDDFALRAGGDIGCIPLRVWEAGIMDAAPGNVDHATIAAARWGRNGWGAALLMRDVTDDLIGPGDEPVSEAAHLGFLDDLAAFSARTWRIEDRWAMLPPGDALAVLRTGADRDRGPARVPGAGAAYRPRRLAALR